MLTSNLFGLGDHVLGLGLLLALHLGAATLVIGSLALLDRGLLSAPARLRNRLWSLGLWSLLLPASGLLLLEPLGFSIWSPWSQIGFPAEWIASPSAAVSAGTSSGSDLGAELGAGIALVLWGGGVVAWVVRLRLLRPSFSLRRIADLPADRRIGLEGAARRAGVDPTHLRWTPEAALPCVVGVVHPRIIIPDALLDVMESEDLAAIIRHEDAHRRRRDPLRLAAQRTAFVLFYFFPPLWLVLHRLHATCEMVCDEDVVAAGFDPRTLARAIGLSLTLGVRPRGRGPLSAPASLWSESSGSLLRKRLHRLETMRRNPTMHRHQIILSLGGLVFAAALALPLALQAEEKTADSQAKLAPERSSEEDSTSVSEASEDAIQPPEVIHAVPARYPEAERQAQASGRVLLSTVIDVEGQATSIEVVEGVEGYPAFAESASAALAQWEFKPASKGGTPTAMKIAVPFLFQLN